MKHIVDIKIKTIHSSVQIIVFFENSYGASIVKHMFSYEHEQGLFEIAVIKGTIEDWEITYDTPITSDVLGHQTSENINNILEEIFNL